MSIASAIQNAQGKITNAYTAVSNKGGTLPATQNLSNLPTAINSIPASSGSIVVKKRVDSGSSLCNLLFEGTATPTNYKAALNNSSDVTITSGTYTLWYLRDYHYDFDKFTLLATITL